MGGIQPHTIQQSIDAHDVLIPRYVFVPHTPPSGRPLGGGDEG